jgi:hypothetical protein
MNVNLEAVVQLFVKKEKRDRMITLAGKPSRRPDLRHDLLHDTRSLDPAVMTRLADGLTVDAIAKALRAASSSGTRAYSISEVIDADDQESSVIDALRAVVGRAQDSLVFVIGTRAAYYENHEGEQYILQGRSPGAVVRS